MRSGAGYVVTGVPQAIYPIIAPSLVQSPFCFIETAADVAGALTGASAIAIGCGMGTGQRQRGILGGGALPCQMPVVIDADGINNLAMDISIVADAKCPVILTPHFGEMAKICRTSVSEIQKAPLLCAQELARAAQGHHRAQGRAHHHFLPGRLHLHQPDRQPRPLPRRAAAMC